ncbi:hypothetical protein D030_1464A, partial [Vibrio parahaemolyticus AQ3810]
MARFWCLK